MATKARRTDKGVTRFVRDPRAQVAELVDALVSGTSDASRGGSSPLLGTSDSQTIRFWVRVFAASIFPKSRRAHCDKSAMIAGISARISPARNPNVPRR